MKLHVFVLGISISTFSFAQNIGINTPTPNAALDVRSTGSTSATYGVLVSNNTNDTSLVVSDNGNVGIGTTLPAYTLDVQSSNPIAARFSGRVSGQNAVNANEFITLQQAGTLSSGGTSANISAFSSEAGPMNYSAALIHCRNLTEGGHTDWFLPTIEQFEEALMKDAVALPTLTTARYYWLRLVTPSLTASNTTGSSHFRPTYYFNTTFQNSYFIEYPTSRGADSYPIHVICVR